VTIKCPKCQADNPDTKQFCGDCGTPLPTAKTPHPEITETLQTPIKELTTGLTFAGRFQVIEELGKGGMGKVYKVFDTRIKEKVALKLIKPEVASDRDTIERFNNELRLSRKVRHKNVCGMFDLGEAEGSYFITMEYVHGEDLKSMIRMSTGLTVGTVLSIGKQVCDGLAEAHSLGVVHRDLKPQNVMIDKGGNAKIMDFGIARSIREKGITGPSVLIGTPEYMSPEQAEAKEVDQRSDIYSLGIILYEMATGRVPFEGETALSIAMKQKGEIPKNPKAFNPNIPDSLSNVILKCLEKDKARRYQTVAELGSELEKIEKRIPTTERVMPEKKAFTSKEITIKFNLKKLLIPGLVMGALVIAAVIIIWRVIPQKAVPPAKSAKQSIAVLPFIDMSPQKDQEYFCDGLTEELINRLSNIKELKVPARTSVFFFKGKAPDIQEIGQKLKVEKVLEGSVRKAGNELRITAQLINIADGYHLWSETYDRELKDVFSIQDEIALQILNNLKIELLGEIKEKVVKRPTNNNEAYDSYMRGMWLFNNKLTEEDWRKAILYFERAIEIDPNFSLAYVGIAKTHLYLSFWHFVSAYEALPRAKKALQHALKIDYELPEALVLSGLIQFRFEYDWSGGESDIKKALELNPNSELAHSSLATILLQKGQFDKAIEEYSAALELDPLSLRAQGSFTWRMYQAGRYDDAIRQCKKSLELDPEYPSTLAALGVCYIQKSLFQEAIAPLQKAVASSGNGTEYLSYLAYAYVLSGNLEKAHEILKELAELSEHVYVSKFYLAPIYAAMGDKDKAFESLESAWKERDADLIFLKTDPKFAVLRSDPRYEMMLKKIGLEK